MVKHTIITAVAFLVKTLLVLAPLAAAHPVPGPISVLQGRDMNKRCGEGACGFSNGLGECGGCGCKGLGGCGCKGPGGCGCGDCNDFNACGCGCKGLGGCGCKGLGGCGCGDCNDFNACGCGCNACKGLSACKGFGVCDPSYPGFKACNDLDDCDIPGCGCAQPFDGLGYLNKRDMTSTHAKRCGPYSGFPYSGHGYGYPYGYGYGGYGGQAYGYPYGCGACTPCMQ